MILTNEGIGVHLRYLVQEMVLQKNMFSFLAKIKITIVKEMKRLFSRDSKNNIQLRILNLIKKIEKKNITDREHFIMLIRSTSKHTCHGHLFLQDLSLVL